MSVHILGTQSTEPKKLILPNSSAWTESTRKPAYKLDYKDRGNKRIPDRGFTKQLKMIKKSFEVVWDWYSSFWEIWDFPEDGNTPYCVTRVQTKDKSYRELGADVLISLMRFDPNRVGYEAILNYLEESENQLARRKQKDFMNRIESEAWEHVDLFRGIQKIQVPRKYKIARAVR